MRVDSPLRYPGGKGRLAPFFMDVIEEGALLDGWYAEPYAGGAGVALALLFGEYVREIHINDLSPPIYAFWVAARDHTERFCRRIDEVPLTVEEWRRQREILASPGQHSCFDLGFAAFFVNRTSRSGILSSSGVIGGLEQKGRWKIDARFSRSGLSERIRKIGRFRDRIRVSGLDAAEFLLEIVPTLRQKGLLYLDPPYFDKGDRLYEKYYGVDDHRAIEAIVRRLDCPWIVTYDDVPQIREIYRRHDPIDYRLSYSAAVRRTGREVMYASSDVRRTIIGTSADLLGDVG